MTDGNTREIPLSRGKVAIVDAADYEWLSQWKWYCSHYGYAVRNKKRPCGKRTIVSMHREILSAPVGTEIDHINMNRLDNRRCNIRIVTPQQNKANRISYSGSKSKYKGVYWLKAAKRWYAQIRVDRKQIHLGCFDTPEECAKVYNQAALKHFGEHARLNKV